MKEEVLAILQSDDGSTGVNVGHDTFPRVRWAKLWAPVRIRRQNEAFLWE